MLRNAIGLLIVAATLSVTQPAPFATAQQIEAGTVHAATAVLNESMATPGHRIPQAMLADAYGVAIIPNVIKGSFVIGARHGRGLLFIREADGIWHAPVFVTLTGGNIGWQVGVQSSDIILVFKTQKSVQGILQGKLTIGADAAAAAGPVGRQTAMATDGQLKAEIYTYSRSRGLFAGVSIDGSVVRMDPLATSAYYHSAGPGQPMVIPPAAQQLTQTIAAYAGSGPTPNPPATPATPVTVIPSPASVTTTTVTPTPQSPSIVRQNGSEADVLRTQLTQIAPELYELLDAQWKSYLALPSSLFLSGTHPTPEQLASTVQNFNAVATNPQYQELASRPEFQSVYGILRHYQQSLTNSAASIQLPPPPS
ncbi:MAG: lipid-binding SYLF domain-containing protein [Rubripirellula sp.]